MPGVAKWHPDGIHANHLYLRYSELLTMNNIKLFGTTIRENINNSMWNWVQPSRSSCFSLIGASTLIAGDGSKQEGGIR